MSEAGDRPRDTERLRRFFAEVHANDRAPFFERMTRLAEGSRGFARAWRPALGVLAVGAMAIGAIWLGTALGGLGSDPLSESQQLALAHDLSTWEAPLDFLLETPGREIFYSPPSFELMEIPIPPTANRSPVLGEDTP